jgi:hypothetical protein
VLPLETHLAAIYALLKDHAVQEPNFKVCFSYLISSSFGHCIALLLGKLVKFPFQFQGQDWHHGLGAHYNVIWGVVL